MNSAHICTSRCEGNMISSLDDQNPTQLLLSCIRESGLSGLKDDAGFVLGVFENGKVASSIHCYLTMRTQPPPPSCAKYTI